MTRIISSFYSMRVVLIVLFALISRIDSHGQHGGGGNQPAGGQPHVARKMEDYVHDMEYENIFFK
jgi:hypothetical protein